MKGRPPSSRRRRRLAAAIAGAAMLPWIASRAGAEIFVSLGTGELSGVYYPVGKDICQIVNRDIDRDGVRCSPETTPGSVYNIDSVRSGELEFALVQSDVQFEAYSGTGPWKGHPFRGLRTVASLYPELVTIMVRAGSPIRNILELAGHSVNAGSRDSGTRATWEAIAAALGWHDDEPVHATELRGYAAKSALCSGAIDANLLIVGHPSPLVTAQAAACSIDFVAVAGPAIDKLVRDHPYYRTGTIGGAAYGMASTVPTFGVRATLVTSTAIPAPIVSVLARALFTHIAELRKMHPALAGLTAGAMTRDAPTAPLDSGAAQVYKQLDAME